MTIEEWQSKLPSVSLELGAIRPYEGTEYVYTYRISKPNLLT